MRRERSALKTRQEAMGIEEIRGDDPDHIRMALGARRAERSAGSRCARFRGPAPAGQEPMSGLLL
jgi:hypothetical protein